MPGSRYGGREVARSRWRLRGGAEGEVQTVAGERAHVLLGDRDDGRGEEEMGGSKGGNGAA